LTRKEAYQNFTDLVKDFKSGQSLLRSDGAVLEQGTVSTRSGTFLTSSDVLNAFQEREARAQEAEDRARRAVEAQQRRAQREREASIRAAARAEREPSCLALSTCFSGEATRVLARAPKDNRSQ